MALSSVVGCVQEKTLDALKRMTEHGPDVCIEAVGALPAALPP